MIYDCEYCIHSKMIEDAQEAFCSVGTTPPDNIECLFLTFKIKEDGQEKDN